MYPRAITLLLASSWILLPSEAQVPFAGACPTVVVMKDFDVSKYMGRWYEAERYAAAYEMSAGRCVTAQYSANPNGTVDVTNREVSISGQPGELRGLATQTSQTEKGKLAVWFPSMPFNVTAPYWVLGTDYDNYAVVWACSSLGTLIHTRSVWILTRKQIAQGLDKAESILDQNGLSRTYLKHTDQQNCTSAIDASRK